MVKRLRRRPLTAKTGVRFPMGLPKKKDGFIPFFFFWFTSPGKRKADARSADGFRASAATLRRGGPRKGFRRFPHGRHSFGFFRTVPVLLFWFASPGKRMADARSADGFRASAATLRRGGPCKGFRRFPHGRHTFGFFRTVPVLLFWFASPGKRMADAHGADGIKG